MRQKGFCDKRMQMLKERKERELKFMQSKVEIPLERIHARIKGNGKQKIVVMSQSGRERSQDSPIIQS